MLFLVIASIFAVCTGSMRVACPFSAFGGRYVLDITILLGVQQFTEQSFLCCLGLTDETLTALIYFYQVVSLAVAQGLCDL